LIIDNIGILVKKMDQQIYSIVAKAISKQKMIDPSTISESSTLEALSISSLDAITIMYEIEDALDIEIPNEVLENLRSVKDILVEIALLVQSRD
jgi:acyl carrier protein